MRSLTVRTLGIFTAGLVVSACGGGVAGAVRDAVDTSRVPADLVVTYQDHHPSWGGERIAVRGDGQLTAERWQPGQEEDEAPRSWSGEVPAEAMLVLVQLLADIEAWDQREDDDGSRIDDGRARLEIRVGGERSSVWEWANDLHTTGRLVRIKEHLQALAFEVRHPNVDAAGAPPGIDDGG